MHGVGRLRTPLVLLASRLSARGVSTSHLAAQSSALDTESFILRNIADTDMGKEHDLNPASTSAYVQVLGVGADAPSTAPSVLLFFDRQRYLFNMGEGYQRYCVERKIKLSRVSALLLTRVSAATVGGLPGALLTMADSSAGGLLAGQAGLTVHGPRGLGNLINAYRTFVNLKDLGLRLEEFGDDAKPAIKNDLVTISPVALTALSERNDEENGREAKRQKSGSGVSNDVTAMENEGAHHAVGSPSPTATSAVAVSYIAELPDVPGKFLPQRAAALGVPRGPAYGRLVRGESVTATSGATVTPADVMEPASPGPAVFIIDCPGPEYVESLRHAADFEPWATEPAKKERLQLIVHLAPPSVLSLPAYRDWAARFGANTTHILVAAAPKGGFPVMRSAATMQARLNTLDAKVFPLQQTLLSVEKEGTFTTDTLPSLWGDNASQKVVPGEDLLRFHLRPVAKSGLDRSDVLEALDAAAVQAELEGSAAGETLRGALNPDNHDSAIIPQAISSADARSFELTFLGTGAAIPSKYRNVTGTLVDLFDQGAFLVDCGEGSLGQLERTLGAQSCQDVLRRLKAVWISHVHADHHVGLLSVLTARQEAIDRGAGEPPLIVIAPRTLRRAISVYGQLQPGSVRWLDTAFTVGGQEDEHVAEEKQLHRQLQSQLGLKLLQSIAVEHCAHAYGLVLESSNEGWKVVFSGDTRPCEAVALAAKDATLLVHEATFEDELAEEAEAKNHSTTAEAISIAAKSNAYRTILTHFSQRYPKIPVIDENFQSSIAIAFDLMRVNLKDLPNLPGLVPKLKILFAEEDAEEA